MELSVSHRVLPSRSLTPRLRLRRSQSGAAMVEFAIVAPIFFFILYALIVFGMALALKQSVTNAAAEGARSAVGLTGPAAETQAETEARDRLGWLSASQLAVLQVDATAATCDSGSGECITVVVNYPYEGNELVPPAPIINHLAPENVGSRAIVQIR
jgi:Flp pilus assembly protein TadG